MDCAAPATHIKNDRKAPGKRRSLGRMAGLTLVGEIHPLLVPALLGVRDIIRNGAMNIGMEVSGHSII
jgi:hypothetical protein